MRVQLEPAEAIITAKATADHAALPPLFAGAAMQWFGSALATRVPALADRIPYNRARGFALADRDHLDGLLAFYTEEGIPPAIEVSSLDACEELHDLLRGADLMPGSDAVTLYHAGPAAAPIGVDGLEIRELVAHDDRYLDVLLAGYQISVDESAVRQMFAHEHATPDLRRYLALVDGVPAAAAALFTHAGTSLLAGAATLPAFRRRGCQTALITRRLHDAGTDSDLVVVTASAGSASHDNLVGHGFRTIHTRTVWHGSRTGDRVLR